MRGVHDWELMYTHGGFRSMCGGTNAVYSKLGDTGMTQSDVMGREVGGGFRMGNTHTPVIYVNVWQNQYNIVK